MRIPRRSHSAYPEYFDPRRVPPSLTRQERAQVRSPLHQPCGARRCEGGECHAARECHHRLPIGWEWPCGSKD